VAAGPEAEEVEEVVPLPAVPVARRQPAEWALEVPEPASQLQEALRVLRLAGWPPTPPQGLRAGPQA
jgi:hypothetical protein